jgi:methylated-DNA-[protein]-cysteine S-methyltransferase
MSDPIEFKERLLARADGEGILDVAYATIDTPLGTATVAATPRGVVRVALPHEAPESVVEELAEDVSPRVLEYPARLDEARRELDEYFEGKRKEFGLPVDLAALPSFQQLVLSELQLVPYGATATYGGLAERIGRPRAARAVGGALNKNPVPIVVPCHRIVGASGSLVGYAGGLERKEKLLALEGAVLT